MDESARARFTVRQLGGTGTMAVTISSGMDSSLRPDLPRGKGRWCRLSPAATSVFGTNQTR